ASSTSRALANPCRCSVPPRRRSRPSGSRVVGRHGRRPRRSSWRLASGAVPAGSPPSSRRRRRQRCRTPTRVRPSV
ncbi:MAG: hypothetical protein AVDCRST_MAG73-2135, partial [uncultured Thermomicrobiales bacterium]